MSGESQTTTIFHVVVFFTQTICTLELFVIFRPFQNICRCINQKLHDELESIFFIKDSRPVESFHAIWILFTLPRIYSPQHSEKRLESFQMVWMTFPGFPEYDDGGFFGSVRPHRRRSGMGVVKGDWLFTPPLYHKAFNCFF